jgi:uncharacterized protein (TIGR02271 family)
LSENPVNSRESDTKGGPIENWDRIIHKNVRTSDGEGYGKVIAIPDNENVIIISLGSSEQYRLDRANVSGFNGAEVMLDVTAAEMESYRIEHGQTKESQPSNLVMEGTEERREGTIPLVEERLNVKKKTRQEEATIRKESIKESKTIEVPVSHDELIIERRPASGNAAEPPTEKGTDLRIPLNKEEVKVTKEPYVKEELVVRKEPKTETKTVTETLRSERIVGSDLPIDKDQK